ncbi:MAG: hypothetical protein E6J00_08500 [Chloroflexi bacterium]|nr:MAG: hypothetical protein E6J00_08500 [Chloroflexota bacterium]
MPERDPELEELFKDRADLEVVRLLKTSRPASPPLDPHFPSYLRSKLMAEARRTLQPAPRQSWFSRLGLGIGPVPALAAVAAAFILVLGYELYVHQPGSAPEQAVRVTSPLSDKTNVAADEIRIDFSSPVDHSAVEASIAIQPATRYTTRWEGQTLVVTPLHQLAANTSYTVELRPAPVAAPRPSVSVAPAPPKPSPTPVIVRFVTAPSPPPPVSASSFASANLTFLGDSRLADPGTFGTAVWSGDGQIVATSPRPGERPAPGASASGSAAASTSPAAVSGSSSGMDLWLLSPRGLFIRRIAEDVITPVVAPQDGRIAFWHRAGDHYALMETVSSATGEEATQLATVTAAPQAEPVWVGSDRVGYVDGGVFHLVDLQGNAVSTALIAVSGGVAGSPDGRRLAVEGPSGSAVYDLTAGGSTALTAGATGFSWSSHGDLAFVVRRSQASELWVLKAGSPTALKLAASQPGDSWGSINWSPDAVSLLFASRSATPGAASTSQAFLIDAAGGSPRQFGGSGYEALDWSPDGRTVLFTRRDETGRSALWVATVKVGALSDLDLAQQSAIAVVTTFMDARLGKDSAGAQSQLGNDALNAYGGGLGLLAPAAGGHFARWYRVTVQLAAANPQSFLIGVRIVEASGKTETGFHEENLTVVRHDKRFLIDKVAAGPSVSLRQGGPSVVAVELRADPSGQQILVHFDSDLAVETVNDSSILIRDSTGVIQKVASVAYDQEAQVATVTVKLTPGDYQLVVTTAVKDYKQQPLSQQYTSPIVVRAG